MENESVVLKVVGKQWFASIRETIPSYGAVGMLCGRVAAALGAALPRGAVAVAIWHDPEYKEKDVDAEAGFYLPQGVEAEAPIRVGELAAATVASLVHRGAYQDLPQAYAALMSWIAGNGYEVAGPLREIYLHMSLPVRQDDASYVTEIQAPVKKTE